jgi:hypothetical protein
MPSHPKAPHIQVDPLNIENKTDKKWIQLALEAVRINGFWPNRQSWLSLCEAASSFNVKKTTLTAHFNKRKIRQEAYEQQKALSTGAEKALVEWIIEMSKHGIPLHVLAVVQHATAISGAKASVHWVH